MLPMFDSSVNDSLVYTGSDYEQIILVITTAYKIHTHRIDLVSLKTVIKNILHSIHTTIIGRQIEWKYWFQYSLKDYEDSIWFTVASHTIKLSLNLFPKLAISFQNKLLNFINNKFFNQIDGKFSFKLQISGFFHDLPAISSFYRTSGRV